MGDRLIGRTPVFETGTTRKGHLGSNPSPPTNIFNTAGARKVMGRSAKAN